MRRSLTLTLLLVGALAVPLAPSQATTVEVVHSDHPDGWGSVSSDCADPANGDRNAFGHPSHGPLGVGSAAFSAGTGDMAGFMGPGSGGFGSLQHLEARVYETPGSSVAFQIMLPTSMGWKALVWRPNPADNQWTVVAPDFASTQWSVHTPENYTLPTTTTTLAAFQAANPDAIFEVGMVSWGCTAASLVYVDYFYYLSSGHDRAYDFQAQPTNTTIGVSRQTLTFGQAVTLSTRATVMGHPAEGAGIQLWARPTGKAWRRVATVTANSEGRASKTVRPGITTTFQWRYPSYVTNEPSKSGTRQVGVRAKVTAELLDDTVRRGERIVVRGKATPRKAGVTATLWRSSAVGNVKLGTTTVRKDGTYRVASGIIGARGSATWKVFVKVPAGGGNLAGQSPLLSVRIN